MVSTLVVGIDAASWDIIDPLLGTGRLPNITELINDGVRGDLRSTYPPLTPVAWTTIATGVNPGKHGIYDFRSQNPDNYQVEPVDYSGLSQPTIWDIFQAQGTSVGVVNFPMAYPPSESCEFFLSGFPSSVNDVIATPSSLQDRIERTGYRVTPSVSPSAGCERYLNELIDIINIRCELSVDLLDDNDIEHMWTIFMAADWAQHYLHGKSVHGQSAVELVYEEIDDAIGRLLSAADRDSNVVLVSDHGYQELQAEVHLNSLLAELGYLRRRTQSQSFLDKVKHHCLRTVTDVGSRLPYDIRTSVVDSLPESVLTALDDANDEVGQEELHLEIDWSETTAFSFGVMGQVYINSYNRYKSGIVDDPDYEQIKTELSEELEGTTHPETGEPIIDEVLDGDELFHGNNSHLSPDLVIVPRDWQYMFYGDFNEPWIHDPEERLADHHPDGIVVFSGPDAGDHPQEVSVNAADITPTILSMCRTAVPSSSDGTVVKLLLDDSSGEDDVRYFDASDIHCSHQLLSSRDDSDVEERLGDLGYL